MTELMTMEGTRAEARRSQAETRQAHREATARGVEELLRLKQFRARHFGPIFAQIEDFELVELAHIAIGMLKKSKLPVQSGSSPASPISAENPPQSKDSQASKGKTK